MQELVARLRAAFSGGRTRSYEWRSEQLAALRRLLTENERALYAALQADLGRSELDAFLTEQRELRNAVDLAAKKLKRWMAPKSVSTPALLKPGASFVQPEPLGVVLIIAPWNYPVLLLLNPLIGAIAAGNAVVLKPSEVSENVSGLLAELLPRYLDNEAIAVVSGGPDETTQLLAQRFDHIFYTGNGRVGRIVMMAAAQHLTPVTLELGGKSPCIVDEHADLEVAARRIVWGKFLNCGQTCIAPDYVLVHEKVHDALLPLLAANIRGFYGDNPAHSPDYGRIINTRHHARIMGLLPGSGSVVTGGDSDVASRYIAPTVLRDVPDDAPVMRDEIFGPLLPVLPARGLEHAISFIHAREKPLALYLFSKSQRSVERVLANTSSGGVVVNHTLMQLAVPGLPFGGVGASGMGAYQGQHTFDTFSHHKAVLRKPFSPDPKFTYPPHSERKTSWLKRLI
jgi:aldehyde dehydrogenase (NAD+)